jgi:hypothetical protein
MLPSLLILNYSTVEIGFAEENMAGKDFKIILPAEWTSLVRSANKVRGALLKV